MWAFALSAVLCAGYGHSMFLRNLPEKPDTKVKHLVQDIEESVSKAGEDAEMVFATLLNYNGQLDTSLKREISTLNQTLTSLLAMQAKYDADLSSTQAKLSNLGNTAQDSEKMASKYQAGSAQTRNKFDSLQDNVKMLIALLKDASVTPQGNLVTAEVPDARGEPARVYIAIRRLLGANPDLQNSYPEVFASFLTPPSQEALHFPTVQMTEGLLQQTITALSQVGQHFQSMESEALLQFSSLHQRFEEDAVSTGARAAAQQGVEADNEQKSAELTFSIKFTSAVLKIDQSFAKSIGTHLKSNADLIYAIRDLRQAQLKVLQDLTDIFGSESNYYRKSISTEGLSLLETNAKASPSHPFSLLGGLQSAAETAIHNHGDTHAFLMRVRDMLDEAEPINAHSVRETMKEIEGVLESVESQQSKLEEAKRGCETQKFHAKEGAEGLKANLALMSTAYDHAKKAIKAAHTNIQGIEKKTGALNKSSSDFSRITAEATKSLEAQSKDRQTIMMAVEKAIEVIAPVVAVPTHVYSSAAAGTAKAQLMRTLSEDIAAQELKESAFREQQDAFQSLFLAYVRDYTQMLDERRRHYEASLGVLELHVTELASDLSAQKQTVSTGDELSQQSAGLCESVLHFYDKHVKTRAELSTALRSILPSMPTVLSNGAIASPGDWDSKVSTIRKGLGFQFLALAD